MLKKEKISYLELLGEMQYAFVTFMLGENFDSFEHWKKLVILLSQCKQAIIQTHKDLYFRLIPVLYAQIEQLPDDFFYAELSKDNFICKSMSELIQTCKEELEVSV